ncbi:unnamed protein product [Mytilus edulis]|uniref:Protein quiver n=1 Tax=Mytilus edulis TaxID=6550 RepID=A0A8S3RFT0_MYTED|nr:unnamed protein product [Mytilus edulis]
MKTVWIVGPLFFVVLIFETQCETRMCFACRDTSSEEGKNDCQVNTGRMEELHTKLIYEYKNDTDVFMRDFINDPYVQSCSVLAGHNYCCKEEYKARGFVKAYIRTCCDGINWSFNTTVLKKMKNIQPSNDSLCEYKVDTEITTCVSMCRGNFCNGPSAAANDLHTNIALIGAYILYKLYSNIV